LEGQCCRLDVNCGGGALTSRTVIKGMSGGARRGPRAKSSGVNWGPGKQMNPWTMSRLPTMWNAAGPPTPGPRACGEDRFGRMGTVETSHPDP